MSEQPVRERATLANIVGILGSLLIVGALAWAIHHYTQPQSLTGVRAAERAKALAELRATESVDLDTTGWVDPGKGIVRLRIDDAMKWVEREWAQNPAAARSNLIARVEKATAAPPKVPEKPSPFE